MWSHLPRELQKNSQLDRKKAQEIAQDWPFSVREYYLWYRMQTKCPRSQRQALWSTKKHWILPRPGWLTLHTTLASIPNCPNSCSRERYNSICSNAKQLLFLFWQSSNSWPVSTIPTHPQISHPFLIFLVQYHCNQISTEGVNREFMQNCHGITKACCILNTTKML